ncbi:MAG: selenide, water dikinase SelD [Halioglobus sp.]
MQASREIVRDLVFIGGGHAHALALRMLAMKPISGVRVTLISPESHTPYSGMLPGLLAGHYTFEDAHIDLARLCQWAGVRFIAAEVTAIQPQQKVLSLRGRPSIAYDLLSVDTGSAPELDSVPGARKWAVPVKPVADLWQRWLTVSAKLEPRAVEDPYRIAVVGGGAGSVELVLAMAQHFNGTAVRFSLFCGASRILQNYNGRARRSVERALVDYGIDLYTGERVVAVEQQALCLAGGGQYAFDDLFWCTGAVAVPWISASGLATDDAGFLAIRDTLQVVGQDSIFAAGDVATQLNHPRAKAGVYAVRQGPVLAQNLRNVLLNKPLKQHHPQRNFLSLISLGGRCATADRGLLNATGGWVWRWKDRIDRAFMARFRDLPARMPGGDESNATGVLGEIKQAHCGGCGAKIGAASLSSVLAGLAVAFPRHCPNGGKADDAALIPGAAGLEIVQSIDVLREMVKDPWLMGRIAANHALSDLYASGATPLSALAAITLPFASPAIQERELQQILSGALREFAAADCKLQGGHSLQGQELSIGFVVNGTAQSAERGLLAKTGLLSGNHLLLTKPLGTGALFASHMQLKADGRHVQAAVDMMLQSNAAAGRLAVEFGATACTDVTGFGLLGHLLEMLDPELGVTLSLDQVPLLPGAREAIAEGVYSTMHEVNIQARESIGPLATAVDSARLDLLVDPQTSGGLLIGVDAGKSDALCAALQAGGYTSTAIIGEVRERNKSRFAPVEVI